MKFIVATKSLLVREIRRLAITVMTASALALLSGCGSDSPSGTTPGTEQTQPLTWGSGTWNNSDWARAPEPTRPTPKE